MKRCGLSVSACGSCGQFWSKVIVDYIKVYANVIIDYNNFKENL